MNSTRKVNSTGDRLCLTTPELQNRLGCGRQAALEIGNQAEAKIQVGRRILWNVQKIQDYLNRR